MPTQRQRNNSTSNGDGEILVLRWSTRRSMAWKALIAFFGGTFVFWFLLPPWLAWWNLTSLWSSVLGDTYFWFATGSIAITLAYMGITTFPFWNKGGDRNRFNQIDEEPDEINTSGAREREAAIEDDIYDPTAGSKT